jgi:hypothetical protein
VWLNAATSNKLGTTVKIFIAALLLLLSIQAQAFDDEGKYSTIGFGTMSCSKVVKVLADMENPFYYYASGWRAGYFTALNRNLKVGYDIMEDVDVESQDLWMVNYCTHHPLKDLAEATHMLYLDMHNK